MSNVKPSLLFVGPFPPPVHGQSVATKHLADVLDKTLDVRRIDTAGSSSRRLSRHALALQQIIVGREKAIYLSINSNRGIILTAMLARAARIRGKAIFLHHHSYRCIGTYGPDMERLIAAAGDKALHITNCGQMSLELRNLYPTVRNTASLPNIGSVDEALLPTARPTRPVTIGHMSNLTEEKGLGRALDAFAALLETGIEARLEVAGPDADAFAAAALAEAKTRFGHRFTYHGPVYGERKQAFFNAIDIFAFPSLYPVETQGIVNLEAMACGKPVVAFAQCCIAADIGTTGGSAIGKGESFSQALIEYARTYIADPEGRAIMARQRFEELATDYRSHLEALCETISVSAST